MLAWYTEALPFPSIHWRSRKPMCFVIIFFLLCDGVSILYADILYFRSFSTKICLRFNFAALGIFVQGLYELFLIATVSEY